MDSRHNNDLPTRVNPEDLPLRKKAPCWADGRVYTIDDDSKEAQCECKYMICLVDDFNDIVSSIRKSGNKSK